MELFQQMILDGLAKGELTITMNDQASAWLEGKCYQTLKKIKAVIEDDSLEDAECFMKIEEIVSAFEEIGSDGGLRHDFG